MPDLDYRCKELVDVVGQLCILHSPDPKKDLEQFRRKVASKQDVADLDFRGTVFTEETEFSGVLKDADFYESTFEGNVVFTFATFQGEADFYGSRFLGNAQFSGATFQGLADFSEAAFQRQAQFWVVRFLDEADFSKVAFLGPARFSMIMGHEGVIHPTFKGRAEFSDAGFGKEVEFDGATFETAASFHRATFHGDRKSTRLNSS